MSGIFIVLLIIIILLALVTDIGKAIIGFLLAGVLMCLALGIVGLGLYFIQ